MLSSLKFKVRVVPLRRAVDVETAGAYSTSLTIFAQSSPVITSLEINLSEPVDVSKAQVKLGLRAVGDAGALHSTDMAAYLNFSRSRLAFKLSVMTTSRAVDNALPLNKLAEEDILHPWVPLSFMKRFVSLASFCLIS